MTRKKVTRVGTAKNASPAIRKPIGKQFPSTMTRTQSIYWPENTGKQSAMPAMYQKRDCCINNRNLRPTVLRATKKMISTRDNWIKNARNATRRHHGRWVTLITTCRVSRWSEGMCRLSARNATIRLLTVTPNQLVFPATTRRMFINAVSVPLAKFAITPGLGNPGILTIVKPVTPLMEHT